MYYEKESVQRNISQCLVLLWTVSSNVAQGKRKGQEFENNVHFELTPIVLIMKGTGEFKHHDKLVLLYGCVTNAFLNVVVEESDSQMQGNFKKIIHRVG